MAGRRPGDDTFGDDSGNGIVLLPSAAANETYGAASLVTIRIGGLPCMATVLVGFECVKLDVCMPEWVQISTRVLPPPRRQRPGHGVPQLHERERLGESRWISPDLVALLGKHVEAVPCLSMPNCLGVVQGFECG